MDPSSPLRGGVGLLPQVAEPDRVTACSQATPPAAAAGPLGPAPPGASARPERAPSAGPGQRWWAGSPGPSGVSRTVVPRLRLPPHLGAAFPTRPVRGHRRGRL